MPPDDQLDESMARNEIVFDPDYWENMAEQRRNQAMICADNPRFYAVLMRHAEELDRLAQMALKLRQDRNRMGRVSPKYRIAEVVPINPTVAPARNLSESG